MVDAVVRELLKPLGDGLNIVKDAQGNIFSIIKDATNGTVKIFQNGIEAYVDTEQNFLAGVQQIATEYGKIGGTIALDFESKALATVDSFMDNGFAVAAKFEHDMTNTFQVFGVITLLGTFVVFMIFGKPVLTTIQKSITGANFTFAPSLLRGP